MMNLVRRFSALPDTIRGIIWMVITQLIFAANNGLWKYAAEIYTVGQIVWTRYLTQFGWLMIILLLMGRLRPAVRCRRPGLQLAIAGSMLASMVSFVFGVQVVPLGEATVLLFIAPIFVCMLSVPMLGEAVGPRRWASVLVGILGTAIVLQPGADLFAWEAALPASAAFFYALFQIFSRLVSRADQPLTTLFYSTLTGLLASSLYVAVWWVPFDTIHGPLLLSMGALGATSHFTILKSFQAAPAVVVTPFAYVQLVFAIGIGWLVWNDLPGPETWAGAALIMASGLYIFHRERVRRQTGG